MVIQSLVMKHLKNDLLKLRYGHPQKPQKPPPEPRLRRRLVLLSSVSFAPEGIIVPHLFRVAKTPGPYIHRRF